MGPHSLHCHLGRTRPRMDGWCTARVSTSICLISRLDRPEVLARVVDRPALDVKGTGIRSVPAPQRLAPEGANEVGNQPMPAQPAASDTGTATILFTDLVGSTTLRARLGEERAEGAPRTTACSPRRSRPPRHADDDLGDGIMASFAGAADAVAAAVAIQQAIDGRQSARRPTTAVACASGSARATSRGRRRIRTACRWSRRRGSARRPRAGRSSSPTSCACSRAGAAATRSRRSGSSR